jgi:hypothetical protein
MLNYLDYYCSYVTEKQKKMESEESSNVVVSHVAEEINMRS